ncbi:MAG: YfdX family protein [Coleofasciculus sp.]|uniref:YfdX family protein n=1 Tax=Coleofasciculus sp. TaxID=3100458 RepID=UPI003A443BCE
MSDTQIHQVSDKELQQQTEQEKERTITELEKRLVQEAVNAIQETKDAIAAIDENDLDKAIKAIERATGQLDIILAREPELSLVPIDYTIAIINVAPDDKAAIKDIRKEIKSAVNSGDLPAARRLFNSLASEIRVTVSNLPLATYPNALKKAAKLIDEGNTAEAKGVLQIALSTLVLLEEYQPLPILNARNLIQSACSESDKDKAMQMLANARTRLKLAQELGYAEDDQEYEQLNTEIKNLEQQLKADEDTKNAFEKLKTRIAAFFKRISNFKRISKKEVKS